MLLCSFGVLQAQTTLVKGNVTGDGGPLPGVSVLVKGSTTGTITDFDGNFKINAKSTDVLLFSFLGFNSKEVKINGRSSINVELKTDVTTLNDVVVIGYGTQKKKEVTGAVGQIQADELIKNATSDLGVALQGQISGVNVTASSGQPGADSNILIRGLNSVIGQSAPLYIVDGIPFDGDPKLSTNEIETIDVLKDAASAAIYGTRGAAGVILITTKKGKMGKMKIGFDSYYGVQKINSSIPTLSFEDNLYVRFLSNQTLTNGNYGNTWTPIEYDVSQLTNNTDLTKLVQNDLAPMQNHSLSVSGGKEGLAYNVTGTFFNQEGVIIKSGYDRFNLRANTQFKSGKWSVDTGLGFRVENQEYPAWQLLLEAFKYAPFQSEVFLNTTSIVDPGTNLNSNEIINSSNLNAKIQQTDVRKGESFNANINAKYQVNKDLDYSLRIGTAYTNNTRVRVNPLFKVFNVEGTIAPQQQRSGVYNYSDRSNNLSIENIVNYKKSFGKHNLSFLGVYSREYYEFSSFFAEKKDLFNNDLTTLKSVQLDANVGTGKDWGQDKVNTLTGLLARVQYNYKGKYLLSLSARRDGSSRFSEENRYQTFPSISAGWNVSDEDFWQPLKGFANSFKLRASRGTTGNQGILDYSFAPTVAIYQDYVFGGGSTDKLALGASQTSFANPNVKWETSVQNNFGIDLAFLNNRLTLTSDIYETTKQDLLFPLLLPPSIGSGANSTVILNLGNMRNRGVEFAANYRSKLKKFNWSTGMTFSRNVNMITKMNTSNNIAYLDGSTLVDGAGTEDLLSVITEGREAGAFFLIKTNGVIKTDEELVECKKLVPDANKGDLRYVEALTVDTDNDGIADAGDGIIDAKDRQYAGSGTPDFELGWNFSADYKNFDFSMQWYGSFGAEVMNGSKAFAYKFATHKDLVYQWTPQNTNSNIPTNRGRDDENYRGFTDYWLEDGTFARLKNISIGYTLPKSLLKKANISKIRIYVAAQNLITLTKYTGFDPEVGNNGLSTKGLDKGNYPFSKQIRAGVQLDF